MKIGVIHANTSAVDPLREAFLKADPEITLVNFCNEELLQIVDQKGYVTKEALRMFAKTVFAAADAGVDGIMIACSVYCSYAGLMQNFLSVPIIAVDAPAVKKAVLHGGKIGILATTASSAPACRGKLEKEAEEAKKTGKDKKLEYEEGIVTEAMDALKAGNGQEHDRLLRLKSEELVSKGCTSLFLSQITMARAADCLGNLGVLVLSTPDEGVRELIRQIGLKKSDKS